MMNLLHLGPFHSFAGGDFSHHVATCSDRPASLFLPPILSRPTQIRRLITPIPLRVSILQKTPPVSQNSDPQSPAEFQILIFVLFEKSVQFINSFATSLDLLIKSLF